MKICMNAIIIKPKKFSLNYDLKCYFYVFILRPSDLITTFTFLWTTFVLVLVDIADIKAKKPKFTNTFRQHLETKGKVNHQ